MSSKTKDPDDILDYPMDWSVWMETGDAIITSEWIVPTGITKDSDAILDSRTTTIWLSGGTLGANYELVNRITTTQGRTRDKTVILRVRAR